MYKTRIVEALHHNLDCVTPLFIRKGVEDRVNKGEGDTDYWSAVLRILKMEQAKSRLSGMCLPSQEGRMLAEGAFLSWGLVL